MAISRCHSTPKACTGALRAWAKRRRRRSSDDPAMTVVDPEVAKPSTALPAQRVVDVTGLSVRFSTSERTVDAVRDLSFHVDRGETLAIVGESGSGKSVTSLALMRLVEHGGGRIVGGRMLVRRRGGEVLDLAQASQGTMRGIRGAD